MSMDTWRLSRIEEELERLDFGGCPAPPPEDDPDFDFPPDCNGDAGEQDSEGEDLPPPPPPLSYNIYYKTQEAPVAADEGEIYSKVVIRPAYKSPTAEEKSKEGLKFITEKYDSLGKVRPLLMPPALPPPSNSGGLIADSAAAPTQTVNSAAHTVYGGGMMMLGNSREQQHPQYQQHLQQQQQQQQQQTKAEVPFPYRQQQQQQEQDFVGQSNNMNNPTMPPALNNHFDFTPMPSGNGNALPLQNTGCPGLTDQDLVQVEMFFKGHKTEVFVCQSMANLYYGTLNSSPSKGGPNAQPEKWTFVKAGIPVLVLDSGESRRQRKLSVVLAERGTGFALWKDSMNHLSDYKAPHGTFHTMHFSSDHTRVAGLSFDDPSAAGEFIHKITTLTSDPDDHMLFLSGKGHKKKKDSKFKFRLSKPKYKAPTKADISTPCCFTHITKLDRTDGMSILSTPNSTNNRDSLPSSPARDLQQAPRTSVRLSAGMITRT